MQVGGYCDWSMGRVQRIVQEAKDRHVIRGVGGGIKMDSNWKVDLVVACRTEMPREAVPKLAFGLPDIEDNWTGIVQDRVIQHGNGPL
eukprot:g32125.t1